MCTCTYRKSEGVKVDAKAAAVAVAGGVLAIGLKALFGGKSSGSSKAPFHA